MFLIRPLLVGCCHSASGFRRRRRLRRRRVGFIDTGLRRGLERRDRLVVFRRRVGLRRRLVFACFTLRNRPLFVRGGVRRFLATVLLLLVAVFFRLLGAAAFAMARADFFLAFAAAPATSTPAARRTASRAFSAGEAGLRRVLKRTCRRARKRAIDVDTRAALLVAAFLVSFDHFTFEAATNRPPDMYRTPDGVWTATTVRVLRFDSDLRGLLYDGYRLLLRRAPGGLTIRVAMMGTSVLLHATATPGGVKWQSKLQEGGRTEIMWCRPQRQEKLWCAIRFA